MLQDVLKNMRKARNYTQDNVAQEIGVSRQAVAKWESGESIPDIYNCQAIAKLYDVEISDLLESDSKDSKVLSPKGKFFFGYLEIDEENKVKLPEACLKMMNFKKNAKVLCFFDVKQGIALVDPTSYEAFAEKMICEKEKSNGSN